MKADQGHEPGRKSSGRRPEKGISHAFDWGGSFQLWEDSLFNQIKQSVIPNEIFGAPKDRSVGKGKGVTEGPCLVRTTKLPEFYPPSSPYWGTLLLLYLAGGRLRQERKGTPTSKYRKGDPNPASSSFPIKRLPGLLVDVSSRILLEKRCLALLGVAVAAADARIQVECHPRLGENIYIGKTPVKRNACSRRHIQGRPAEGMA